MNQNSKIYVAGHRGLVGSAILKRFHALGYRNIVVKSSMELDLTQQQAVDDFFNVEKPEYVFFAAAKVGGILANSTYPADFIYKNLMMGVNTIHAAHKYKVKKVLNLGSSCIYPRLAPQPVKESYLLTSELEPTNEAYAMAKIAIVKMCRYYHQQYGRNFISVMPTNQYGENDNFNMETAHVLPMLMRRFHLAKLIQNGDFDAIREDLKKHPVGFGLSANEIVSKNDNKIELILSQLGAYRDKVIVWGDGLIYREFMNSEDLADACIYLMKNKNSEDIGELVNITSGTDILLKDLFDMIKKIVGFVGDIEHDLTKPMGTPRKLMDGTKIQSLGWKPKIPLEEGLVKFYHWYRK
ncbi:MAG: GDP-L-fucose synthase [Holosporaceae bacterium]|jgi:GDP-L-fucose synthase|nr:GDP-L-fucose synthase [Holosporaceae bacterium]